MKIVSQPVNTLHATRPAAALSSSREAEFHSAFASAVASSTQRSNKFAELQEAKKKATSSQATDTSVSADSSALPDRNNAAAAETIWQVDTQPYGTDVSDEVSGSGQRVDDAGAKSPSDMLTAILPGMQLAYGNVSLAGQAADGAPGTELAGAGSETDTATAPVKPTAPGLAAQAGSAAAEGVASNPAATASKLPALPFAAVSDKISKPEAHAKPGAPTSEEIARAVRQQDASSGAAPSKSTDTLDKQGEPSVTGQTSGLLDASGVQIEGVSQSTIAGIPITSVFMPGGAAQGVQAATGTSAPVNITNGAGKDSSSGQAASAAKGKAGSSELRSRLDQGNGDDGGTADATAATPFSEKIVQGAHDLAQLPNSPGGSADASAIQQMAQPDAVAASNGAQSAVQDGAQGQASTLHGQSAAPAGSANASSETPTMSSLSSAQLIQSMGRSEMRLGMHSAEFGAISINTSLNRQALSAQISTGHSELSRALAAHMPAIEEKLSQAYGVPSKVELRDSGAATAPSQDGPGQQAGNNRQSRGTETRTANVSALQRTNPLTSATAASMAAGTSRLDIRI